MRFWRYAALLLLIAGLAGCAGSGNPTAGWSPEHLYQAGRTALEKGDYNKAIDYFQTLQGRYPLGRYAQQAQLEVAYAYYKNSEPKSAIAAAREFIREHPRSPAVPYAYYLIGLADFKATGGIIPLFRPDIEYQVDISPLKRSFAAFKTLVEKYPHSEYAPDARQRMIYLRNMLARHELYVADYYFRRGAWVAVIDRCQNVLSEYPGASDTPRALALMVKAYRKLGMDTLARQTLEVLRLNYPKQAAKLEG